MPAAEGLIDSLNGGGAPLPGSERGFMEPRFGRSFENVRIHTGDRAAAAAQSIGARAFTLGKDIAFARGQYQPGSRASRRLMAHELAHVVQHDSGTTPRRTVRRWSVSGNTARVTRSGDTLGALALRVGGRFNDWKCIKPVSMRTERETGTPADFNAHYERYLRIGDEFDVSNLTATSGTNLQVHLFDAAAWKDAGIATLFYPGMVRSGGDVDADILGAAGDGSTPIQDFVVFGHAGGNMMWGGAAVNFVPSNFDPELPAHSFNLANAGLFPRRCWFTRSADARAVGCNSAAFAQDFAGAYLRRGSSITATTSAVRPFCRGLPNQISAILGDPAGCAWYNELGFTAGAAPGAALLEGPFATVAAFHGAGRWATTQGGL